MAYVGYIASGKGDDNYWVEKNTKGDGIGGHALVVSLKTIGSTGTSHPGTGYAWCTFSTATGSKFKRENPSDTRNSSNQQFGSGYTLTKYFWGNSSYPAFVAVKNYQDGKIANALPAPSNSTGWFMASAGQYYAVFLQFAGSILLLAL